MAEITLLGVFNKTQQPILISEYEDEYFLNWFPKISEKKTLLIVEGSWDEQPLEKTHTVYRDTKSKISDRFSKDTTCKPDILGGDLFYKNLPQTLESFSAKLPNLLSENKNEIRVTFEWSPILAAKKYLELAMKYRNNYEQIVIIANIAITIRIYKLTRLPHFCLSKNQQPAELLLSELEHLLIND